MKNGSILILRGPVESREGCVVAREDMPNDVESMLREVRRYRENRYTRHKARLTVDDIQRLHTYLNSLNFTVFSGVVEKPVHATYVCEFADLRAYCTFIEFDF